MSGWLAVLADVGAFVLLALAVAETGRRGVPLLPWQRPAQRWRSMVAARLVMATSLALAANFRLLPDGARVWTGVQVTLALLWVMAVLLTVRATTSPRRRRPHRPPAPRRHVS